MNSGPFLISPLCQGYKMLCPVRVLSSILDQVQLGGTLRVCGSYRKSNISCLVHDSLKLLFSCFPLHAGGHDISTYIFVHDDLILHALTVQYTVFSIDVLGQKEWAKDLFQFGLFFLWYIPRVGSGPQISFAVVYFLVCPSISLFWLELLFFS